VETKHVSPEPETVGFHQEGVRYTEGELAKVMAAYGEYPVLDGIAIHVHHSYASLLLTIAVETIGKHLLDHVLQNLTEF
jgi:hypothetical protein